MEDSWFKSRNRDLVLHDVYRDPPNRSPSIFQHTQLLSDIALAFGFNSLHNQLRSAIAS
jgi:hypothetical protein